MYALLCTAHEAPIIYKYIIIHDCNCSHLPSVHSVNQFDLIASRSYRRCFEHIFPTMSHVNTSKYLFYKNESVVEPNENVPIQFCRLIIKRLNDWNFKLFSWIIQGITAGWCIQMVMMMPFSHFSNNFLFLYVRSICLRWLWKLPAFRLRKKLSQKSQMTIIMNWTLICYFTLWFEGPHSGRCISIHTNNSNISTAKNQFN